VTTVLSLLATWGQCLKKLESWYLWIAADLVYIPLYQHKGLTLTALLYVGFLSLCVYGLHDWRRSYLADRSRAVGDVPVPA
jgi:nicotinamide mononucleotide transporter